MYGIVRNGEKVTADKNGIESYCNQIVFMNVGDTPVTITIRDTSISFVLAGKTDEKTDYLIFGNMTPGQLEYSVFDAAFSALVTTKQLTVMRVFLSPIAEG